MNPDATIKLSFPGATAATDVIRIEEPFIEEVERPVRAVDYLDGTRGVLTLNAEDEGPGNVRALYLEAEDYRFNDAMRQKLRSWSLERKQLLVFDLAQIDSERRAFLTVISERPGGWSSIRKQPPGTEMLRLEVIRRGTYAEWDGAKNRVTWVDGTVSDWTAYDILTSPAGELAP